MSDFIVTDFINKPTPAVASTVSQTYGISKCRNRKCSSSNVFRKRYFLSSESRQEKWGLPAWVPSPVIFCWCIMWNGMQHCFQLLLWNAVSHACLVFCVGASSRVELIAGHISVSYFELQMRPRWRKIFLTHWVRLVPFYFNLVVLNLPQYIFENYLWPTLFKMWLKQTT